MSDGSLPGVGKPGSKHVVVLHEHEELGPALHGGPTVADPRTFDARL